MTKQMIRATILNLMMVALLLTGCSNEPPSSSPGAQSPTDSTMLPDPLDRVKALIKTSHPKAEIVFVGPNLDRKGVERLVAGIGEERLNKLGAEGKRLRNAEAIFRVFYLEPGDQKDGEKAHSDQLYLVGRDVTIYQGVGVADNAQNQHGADWVQNLPRKIVEHFPRNADN